MGLEPIPMSEDGRDSAFPGEAEGRRSEERFDVRWAVDCKSEETFLYAYITNVSSLGLFVRTEHPLAVGTRIHLCFSPDGVGPFELVGEVAWINPHHRNGSNPNPGMGVRFLGLEAEDRERLVDVIRTIAYVRDADPTN
jgi:type IV pilus assembly protein PilZ